ncbi:P-loop containing nucleoside triphosphate hydrolase protein [Gigaspora rosea]|uniref:P-loop containing nucleoside triphosphate hydrolase protein n=1 Tax=Gigaspora rosea TaxID=44941 RepID=A0A397UD90_9GLOM|nr:P-loop containing nucleoside triphosphate hydrolase protein [Gigaspora rosea]
MATPITPVTTAPMAKSNPEEREVAILNTLERDRGVSIKSMPMTLILQDTKSKSYFFNIMDTTGHVDFVDEVTAVLRLYDVAVIVVDVIKGVHIGSLELKLPPNDAYYKLKYTIEEVNFIISQYAQGRNLCISPERGSVCFTSSQMGWCFY